jgi:hypothetical protein
MSSTFACLGFDSSLPLSNTIWCDSACSVASTTVNVNSANLTSYTCSPFMLQFVSSGLGSITFTITGASSAERAAYPSLPAQASNLAGSLWAWAVSGFSMATEEEQARRMTACHGCPEFDAGRCRICTCFLAAKIRMKTEACPIGKW